MARSRTGCAAPRRLTATTRSVHVTTFEGAAIIATAHASTLVEFDELDALIADLTQVRDQLADAR